MRVLLQRTSEASVAVDGETLAAIGAGLVVFVCAEKGDGDDAVDFFARKVANMRLFADDDGKTNLSVQDVGGEALVISQFTLAADWRRGNRPGFSAAADPETGERLYALFCKRLAEEGVPVKTGRFAAHMDVQLVNDGPMTIWMDSGER
ncbi:MAG: D-tyrosyl-tRNA(Tyr) deacylase [Alphaproteobacteria bacterium]|nr:D-tyrosyl-tRNA(Tyr) deacylase [Alphaproteobacteria bacterium]